MIEVTNVTKRYGEKVAVDDLTFTVQPGIVTGFLGPNGAGKSTTMRLILDLDAPNKGNTLVNGKPYREHQPLRATLVGVNFAELAVGVLGVLVITAEYSTGMIRATFSAVPKRLPVLWGKAMVFGVTAFAVTLPAVFIVFFAGQAILSGRHINIAISHPGVVRALFGAALYLMVMGLFGLGLGAIVRNTAAGISILAALIFVLPPVIGLLPSSVSNSIDPYLPSNAGGAVWTIHPDPNTLAPWTGLALFAGYAALSLAIAAALLLRRDT